jgi:hypothetical protein
MADYSSGPYATLAGGLGGGGQGGSPSFGRPQLSRGNSLRHSTGSSVASFAFPQNPANSGWTPQTQRISGSGGGGAYPQSGGGAYTQNGGWTAQTGRVSGSGGGGPTLYGTGSRTPPGTAGPRPSTSGGFGSKPAGAPITQRLAQIKAVYAAAKFNRSLDSMLQGGGRADRPEVQQLAQQTLSRPREQRPSTPPRMPGQRPLGFTCYL